MRHLFILLLLVPAMISNAQGLLSYGQVQADLIDIEETFDGKVYAISDSALYVNTTDNTGWNIVRDHISTPGFYPTRLEANGFQLFVGTDTAGVWRFTNGTWTQFTMANGLPSNHINDMSISGTGALWVATDSGAAILSGSTWISHAPFIDNNISAIECVGPLVYVGNRNYSESIKRYDGVNWTATPQSILSRNNVSFLEKGKNGTLISVNAAGITNFDNGTWTDITTDGNSDRRASEANNRVIFTTGMSNGLYGWNGSQIDSIQASIGRFGTIKALREGHVNGSTWIVLQTPTQGSFVYLLDYLSLDRDYQFIGGSLIGVLSSNGSMFDLSDPLGLGEPGLRYGNKRLGLLGGLVVGAIESGGQLKVSGTNYRYLGTDWFSGPVGNITNLDYTRKYNRVWHITKAQITAHRNLYNSPNYIAPEVIQNWPGNGDTANGEAWILAPFTDYNLNGIYEPNLGETPEIRGREAVFAIANDSRAPHASGSTGMGVEMHVMMYVADTTGWDAGEHTLFVHTSIKARRGPVYGARIGVLSNISPDVWSTIFGCDSREGVIYSIDDDGTNPDGTVIINLGDSLSGVRLYTDDFGLSNPRAMNFYDAPLWNNLNYKFNDGVPFTVANPNSSTPWSDPNLGYQSGSATTQFQVDWNHRWYEDVVANSGQLMIKQPRDILPGQATCVDYAIHYDRNLPNAWDVHLIDTIIQRASEIPAYFNRHYGSCLAEGLSSEEWNQAPKMPVYPNPTTGQVFIQDFEGGRVDVYDLRGNLLLSEVISENEFDLSSLPPSMYLLKFETERGVRVEKVVVR